MAEFKQIPFRPMAFVRRIRLFRRRIVESLSPAALDALFASASRISEGQISADGCFYGSTILTIEITKVQDQISDLCDQTTVMRLVHFLRTDPLIPPLVNQIAEHEALRIAGRSLNFHGTEVRVRAKGLQIFLDVDVEATLNSSGGQQELFW